MCKETVVLQSDHLIRRNVLIMFLISSHSETATAGHLEGNLEYVTEVILCVLLPTCWQEGRGPSLARSSSHSGESPVQAKLSRTFSSAWARCLTTSRCRPSSARNTSSITCRTTGGKTKGRTDPRWNHVLTFALLCVLLNGNSEKKFTGLLILSFSFDLTELIWGWLTCRTCKWLKQTWLLKSLGERAHPPEVVRCQFEDLKEQREVAWQAIQGYGNLQATGHQTGLDEIILKEDLRRNTCTSWAWNKQNKDNYRPGRT